MGSIYDCDEERSFISEKGDIGFIDFNKNMSKINDCSTEGPVQVSIPFPLVDNKPQSGYMGDRIVDKITILNTTKNTLDLYNVEVYDSKPEESFTLSLMEPPSENSDVEYIQQYLETFSLEDRVLKPGKPLVIWLSCKPKDLGLHTAAVHITTEDGQIERLVFVLAVDKVAESLAGTRTFRSKTKKKQQPNLVSNGFVLGSRPASSSQFYKNKLPLYPIPDDVRELLEKNQIVELIQRGLTKENYTLYFKYLVNMEEIKMEDNMRGYDMEHVKMRSEGSQLLTLEVPGLAERRPSLVYGDYIYARLVSVDEYDCSPTYQGFIHRVEAEVVFLNFEQGFHSQFKARNLYNVQFTYNRLNMRRLYQAIEASQRLEAKFLFPADSLRSRVIHTNPLVPISCLLNEEQKSAVEMILGCKGGAPYVIYGPPGTGKTMTVIEAILQLYRTQKSARILVCAPSNSAADHILEQLIVQDAVRVQNKHILRLNAIMRPLEDIKANHLEFTYYNEVERVFRCPPNRTLRRYKIVISTYASSSLLYAEGIGRDHFSHIFLDEAGQASEPETMVPLSNLCSTRTVVVLAGDPKQLGPVIYSKNAEKYGLGKSYLERLFEFRLYDKSDQNYVMKLVKNYRCHPAILHLPSNLFYQGEVMACNDDDTDDTRFSAALEDLLPNKDFPVLFFGIVGIDEKEGSNPSWFNRIEASKTVEIIRNLTEINGLSDEDIGVIAPYRQQVLKIKKALEGIGRPIIQVGSVEQFQGQERQVIIVSTVRSTFVHKDFDKTHCLGFLSNPRRFNVAITRARSLLIVIGNPHIVCKDPYWNKLLRYCVDNDSYKGCYLPEREDLLEKVTAEEREPWQRDYCELGKQEGFGKLSQEKEWGETSQAGGWNQVISHPPWDGQYYETQDETSQGGGWNQVNFDPSWKGAYGEAQDKTYQGGGWNQVNGDNPCEGEYWRASDKTSQEGEWGATSQVKGRDQWTPSFEPVETSEWSDGWTMP